MSFNFSFRVVTRWRKGLLALAELLVIVLVLNGCASDSLAQADQVTVEPIFKSQFCSQTRSEFSLQWFDDAASWEAYRASLEGDPRIRFYPPSATAVSRVLVVSLGEQTSSGYDLALAEQPPIIEQVDGARELVVPLAVRRPAPGSINAMVMTRPCIGLSIATESQFDYVTVTDSTGAALGRIAVKARPE